MITPIARFIPALFLVLAGCTNDQPQAPLLDPDTVRLLQAGEEALSGGDFEQALLLADSASSRMPSAVQPHFLKGMIYSRTLKWDEAEASYRRVIESDPAYRGIWNNMGNVAFRQDRLRDAVGYYNRELSRYPAVTPWVSVGQVYRELGIADSAEYAFNQAIGVDSLAGGAYLGLAQLFEEEGEFEQGLEYARRAHLMNPESTESQYVLGLLLAKTGNDPDAIPLLTAVTEAWPWHTESHYTLAQAYQRVGRDEESRDVLEKAEKLWQRQADVSYFQKSVSNDPDNPYNYAALATAFRMAGRYGDAIDAYKIALTLDSDNLEFQNNLASLYFLQKDTLAAIEAYRSIVGKDETMANAWLNLGVLYALSGEVDGGPEVVAKRACIGARK